MPKKRRMPAQFEASVKARRWKALERDGFSEAECKWYSEQKTGGKNIQMLKKLRRAFVRTLSEEERLSFLDQMDDLYSNEDALSKAEGEKVYSPRLVDRLVGEEIAEEDIEPGMDIEDQRKEMVEFWERTLESPRVLIK